MADRWQLPYADLHPAQDQPSASAIVVYCFVGLLAVHQALQYLDYPILSPPELLWNALVFLIPSPLVLDSAKRRELRENNMLSQNHAAKGEAWRKILGLGGSDLTRKFTGREGIMRRMSNLGPRIPGDVTSDAPPGLGNWDNSCYQNSVLQGLAALASLGTHLETAALQQEGTTALSLHDTVGKLNDSRNNGNHLWTPAKLKSMCSWQQQDAQEYYSKIMDELDKEAAKAAQTGNKIQGLEALVQEGTESTTRIDPTQNPVEGLLAQKVSCTRCGYSEGLSVIPFNCLTVPLGPAMEYDIRDCLDEYTRLEEIADVECSKCTLLRYETQYKQMLPEKKPESCENKNAGANIKQVLSLPPEIRAQIGQRLQAIRQALEDDDFTDKTLNESCQIPKKGRVSSTKTRQAVVGRAPQCLVVHVNRSVFEEMTGIQRKNYATVRYPMTLNLGDWMLSERPGAAKSPSLLKCDSDSDSGPQYSLKAVVQHYGRHENGHYICYRQHPVQPAPGREKVEQELKWWRLSDEDVSVVDEDEVLGQHGAFMLFYERDKEDLERAVKLPTSVAARPETIEVEAGGAATSDSEITDAAQNRLFAQAEAMASIDEALKTFPHFAPITVHQQQPSPPPTPSLATTSHLETPSSPSTAEFLEPGAKDIDRLQPVTAVNKPPTPPLTLRTAHSRRVSGPRKDSMNKKVFGEAFRPMATT